MNPILALLSGFIVGSIPTTYLLVKWRKKLDIRNEGTGNVGAMNTFEVTGSARLGVAALLVDALKGVAVVLLVRGLFDPGSWAVGAGAVGAILGHNYSPWIGFRGGRGLATALGVSVMVAWIIGAIWLAIFGVAYFIRRDIHTGNIAASFLLPGAVSVLPTAWVGALVPEMPHADIAWITLGVSVPLLLSHLKIIVQLFKPSYRHQ